MVSVVFVGRLYDRIREFMNWTDYNYNRCQMGGYSVRAMKGVLATLQGNRLDVRSLVINLEHVAGRTSCPATVCCWRGEII